VKSVDKKYFVFNRGINTEAPLVAWPEGYTVDEQNWDLLQDGSRRRRLGLSYEAGGDRSFFSAVGSDSDLSSGTKFYRWRNVANTDEVNFIVSQIGSSIYVWNDPVSGPMGTPNYEFDLLPYKVSYTDNITAESYTATDQDVKDSTVSFAEADGKLVVCGAHIESLILAYEDGQLVGDVIKFTERDLFGIDDGVSVEITPEELTDEHRYNLYSRGWANEDIEAVFTDQDVYPAKNMVSFMGLRRQSEAGFADDDGVKVFSPDKLFSEFFQNMSAPQGHITRNPFNRRIGLGSLGQGTIIKTITSIDEVNTHTGDVTITTVEAEHGLNVDDQIDLTDCKVKIRVLFAEKKLFIDGHYTVTEIIDTDSFKINVPMLANDLYTYLGVIKKGQYSIGGVIEVGFEGFEPAATRFSTVASFAGRVFYSGCADVRLSDRIYYSKVIEDDSDFGFCYQEADPTSEFISDLLPTDGGYIVVPNVGTVRAMVPYGRALLVFASEGVWAIGPGESGVFSATGYSVNKITDAGCLAKQSVVVADNTPMYWSTSGIYAIIEDSNSGYLVARNTTQDSINSLYHSIRYSEKKRVKAGYDSVRKRAFFLYNSRLVNPTDGSPSIAGTADEFSTSLTPMGIIDDTDTDEVSYDTALIFDLRLGGWIKWYFASPTIKVRDIFLLPTNYSSDDLNGAIRLLCQEVDTTKYYLGELTSSVYEDWGTETPAYLFTGPDSLGEPERFKYAPYVHVFMRKETRVPLVVDQTPEGIDQALPGSAIDLVLGQRESSLYMQPRWDWARGSDSGKIANYVQIYRDNKTNPDSFGMVVTKNKVRGRGRNLFLCFKAGANAPAWLDGWTIKYDAQVRI
jgi:hypothetical protein